MKPDSVLHFKLIFKFSAIFLCQDNTCVVKPYIIPIQGVILILNVCFFAKEIFQSCLDWSAYIRQWENWLQIFIILGVFLCTVGILNIYIWFGFA